MAMPYLIGGQKMAHIIAQPAVSDFLEFTVHNRNIDLEMVELALREKSHLGGVTLVDSEIRQKVDVIIVAIRKSDGEMEFNPSSQTPIEARDTLISLGKKDDLKNLSAILSGDETK